MAKSKPVNEIRMGAVKACVWANDTASGLRHNVTICRLYKDGDAWKETTSFGRDDLPLVVQVADRAWKWIYEKGNSQQSATSRDAA